MPWRRFIIPGILLALIASVAGLLYWFHGMPPVAFNRPWALLGLAVIPVLIIFSYRGLMVLGELRGWLVLLLRSGIIAALIIALADVRSVDEDESISVLVLVDVSYSMPKEVERIEAPGVDKQMAASLERDLRRERLVQAVREATRHRDNRRDRIGVITFARKPRLEFPATELPELNLAPFTDAPDRNYTDVAAAIRLALASFPEGAGRRILLISDGNENRGDALKEARNARLNGIPIDVVTTKYQYTDEILVDRIDVPHETTENRELPVRVIVRNFSRGQVSGTLTLSRIQGPNERKARMEGIKLTPGLNVLALKWPAELGVPVGSFSYRATFLPDRLPGDRADNNEAWAPVIVRGEGRRVLIVTSDPEGPEHLPLKQAFENAPTRPRAGRSERKIEVDVWAPELVPGEKDPRLPELSNYDCIVLNDVSADLFPKEKQEALRKNTRDQGCGMIFVGGKNAFGAGRWQGEPLEEAMPLNTNIQSLKVQSKGGLVLVMHASEMAEGNYWQKEIARLAVNKLSGQDEVGIIYFDHFTGGHRWHVDLQPIGPNRTEILRQITTMQPGDMPLFDPALRMAHESLTKPEKAIGTKHIILVSDGDHGLLGNRGLLDVLRKDKITMTTVGVTTHGAAAQQALAAISQPTGERHYSVTDPSQLPAIYIKETKVISQSFLYEKPFVPIFGRERADPLREWTQAFPPLYGYVRTTPKRTNLDQILLLSPVPGEDENPLLAQWQYGLGRVVAFTSDAGGGSRSWARDWARDENGEYTRFWSLVLEWAMRNVDESGLSVQSRYENGKLKMTLIDNRDKEMRAKRPLGGMRVTVSSAGSADSKTATLEPTGAGLYEATVDADAAGSYAVTVSGTIQDVDKPDAPADKELILAQDAFTVPYSSEFSAVKSNDGLMEAIAKESGGRVIDENLLADANVFLHDVAPTRNLQPLWHWFVFLAACLLFFDVGVRRVAFDVVAAANKVRDSIARLRGKGTLSPQSQDYMERLRSRKATVGQEIEKKATKRFEAPADVAMTVQPTAAPGEAAAAPQRPLERPKIGADKEEDAADFATRLMRAKQKAREQIDKKKEGDT